MRALAVCAWLTACATTEPARSEPAAAPTEHRPAPLGAVCAELAACCARVKPPDREACDYTVGLANESYCVPTLETYRPYCR